MECGVVHQWIITEKECISFSFLMIVNLIQQLIRLYMKLWVKIEKYILLIYSFLIIMIKLQQIHCTFFIHLQISRRPALVWRTYRGPKICNVWRHLFTSQLDNSAKLGMFFTRSVFLQQAAFIGHRSESG